MKESVADFVKRGGAVKRIDYIQPQEEKHVIHVSTSAAELSDLAEGSLLYIESVLKHKNKKRVKSKKAKKISIDESLIPSTLLSLIKDLESKKNEDV